MAAKHCIQRFHLSLSKLEYLNSIQFYLIFFVVFFPIFYIYLHLFCIFMYFSKNIFPARHNNNNKLDIWGAFAS